MSSSAVAQPSPFQRVAIIDDVFAGPTLEDTKDGLREFCAYVGADEEVLAELQRLTACDFSDAGSVNEAGIAKLYEQRGLLTACADQVSELFRPFDQRRDEVERIRDYVKARGYTVEVFHSIDNLFEGEPFQLVFLDLFLARGQKESEEIAKQVYEKFKAFIILMSNKPGVASREEEFRRKSRLLRGFFHFCEKAELVNEAGLGLRLDSLPKNADVCHAIHEFVDAIENALGGTIEEPDPTQADSGGGEAPGLPLAQFMHTLRTLGLQDYALLCELTLRDEGHPLGDYMIRLLGFHLMARLLSNNRVRTSVGRLDTMRFTEFLPFGEETTDSFKEMYADSLTERIVSPWSSHPWEAVPAGTQAQQASDESATGASGDEAEGAEPAEAGEQSAAAAAEESVSEIMKILKLSDDRRELPFLQLGDLLIRDDSTFVFCVLTASCDLQFTPENVSKNRPRRRDDTVLLLPGTLRKFGDPPPKKVSATTGLVRRNDDWYSIDWFDRKLLGLPHCVVRGLFSDQQFKHEKRLQMGRALELQQTVLSQVSRIGLDVQPPMPMDLAVEIFGKQVDGGFVRLDEPLTKGAMFFHIRDQVKPVLIIRQSTFNAIRDRMEQHCQLFSEKIAGKASVRGVYDKMRAAVALFSEKMVGMKVPIMVHDDHDVKPMRLMDGSKNGLSVSQIGLRVGRFEDEPTAGKDVVFCLSANVS